MAFTPGQAQVLDTVEQAGQFGRAMRKTGRPLALIPLNEGLHAGHIALIRSARHLRNTIVVVAWTGENVPETFREEQVDAVWHYRGEQLWPKGMRTTITPADVGLEPVAVIGRELTRLGALINVLSPSDVVVGEKDYQTLVALQQAITDLHLPLQLHGVPTVRTADGLAISLRNAGIEEPAREEALALSAALTAGAHAAEHGAEQVLDTARGVLAAAGVVPEYLELRGLDLGEAPVEGDARLFGAVTVGGVRLTDNVGLPIGIGFRNLEPEQ
ncbi:MAG TPA: pantoate--beta-alanine ligase [Corynebacterium sp.]|nr:pantoate--beta-alanine ligase [Corynebacterium sp.]